jgi:hypothetical protein
LPGTRAVKKLAQSLLRPRGNLGALFLTFAAGIGRMNFQKGEKMKINWDDVAQAGVLLSAAGMFLTARKSKWGWVVGFLSQPFWLITASANHQKGVLANTAIFTGVYVTVRFLVLLIAFFKIFNRFNTKFS